MPALIYSLAIVLIVSFFLHCNQEEAGPKNKIMGTGEATAIKAQSAEDLYLEAVRKGDLADVREQLAAGADPRARDALGSTAFLLAVRKTENLKLIRFLRQQTPEALNTGDTRGRTPLSWAAQQGAGFVLEYLLKEGAALEQADQDRRGPLFHAVLAGREDAVRLLLQKGAAANTQDRFGDTPLMMAGMKGHVEIARLLLGAGADPGVINQEGKTIHDRARDEKIKALLKAAAP